jgi:hypothetical protein
MVRRRAHDQASPLGYALNGVLVQTRAASLFQAVSCGARSQGVLCH